MSGRDTTRRERQRGSFHLQLDLDTISRVQAQAKLPRNYWQCLCYHLPQHSVLPAHANNVNLRALAQPSKDIAALPQVQHAKDVVREDVQQAEDVSVIQARDRVEPQIVPQEKSWDAEGILVEVARKQHPILPMIDMGTMLVEERGASNASASTEESRKCLVTTCSYHLDIGPWSKIEKDKHTITHIEGNIEVSTDKGRYSLP